VPHDGYSLLHTAPERSGVHNLRKAGYFQRCVPGLSHSTQPSVGKDCVNDKPDEARYLVFDGLMPLKPSLPVRPAPEDNRLLSTDVPYFIKR
jgi:hypothetical protein